MKQVGEMFAGKTLTGGAALAEIDHLRRELAEAKSTIAACNMPWGLYRGKCGHFWDSTDIGIEKCPVCEQLASARQRITELEAALRWADGQLPRFDLENYWGPDEVIPRKRLSALAALAGEKPDPRREAMERVCRAAMEWISEEYQPLVDAAQWAINHWEHPTAYIRLREALRLTVGGEDAK